MWRLAALILIGSSPFLMSTAFSQETEPLPPTKNAKPLPTPLEGHGESQSDRDAEYLKAWREMAPWLALAVLGFAVILIALNFWVMWRSQRYWTNRSFKAFALTLIICAGLFLIVIGFSDKQLAPMMGLLGTLAGYILGAEMRGSEGTGERTDVERQGRGSEPAERQ